VEAYTADLSRFNGLGFVFFKRDGGYAKACLVKTRVDAKYAYLTLEGVNDRDDAEKLRGRYIYIDRENAAPPPPGHYYISDMLGMRVSDSDGNVLGILKDIVQTGGRDVYVVQTDGRGTMMFPSADGVILERDIDKGAMTVDAEKLGEVAVYDI
jgi:16S rRNA processing protein RimM